MSRPDPALRAMGAALALLLAAAAAPGDAQAAGFDCATASSPVEKQVCADPRLSELDGRLAAAYRAAQGATDANGRTVLAGEQRDWIRHTRDICQDAACLGQAYADRIAMLSRNDRIIVNGTSTECGLPGDQACRSVVHYRNPNARIESFNRSITEAKSSGRILGCSTLIDLPVGTASGNHSFGGLCTLAEGGQRRDVMVCDDDMVGHFAMQPAGPAGRTEQALAAFTHTNCFGG